MRRPVALIGILVGSIATVAILVYVISRKGFASAEAAAWLQALGSVGAIWGAVWIAQAAEGRAETKSRREAAGSLQIVSDVASHAHQTLAVAADDFADRHRRMFGTSRNYAAQIAALNDAASALQSLSLERIPPQSGIVTNVMTLRRTLLEAVEALRAAVMEPDAGSLLNLLEETAEECANTIASGARALREELGRRPSG